MAASEHGQSVYVPEEIQYGDEIQKSPFLREFVAKTGELHHGQEWPMELESLTNSFYATVIGFDQQRMTMALRTFTTKGIIPVTETNYGRLDEHRNIRKLPAIGKKEAMGFIALCMVLQDDFGKEERVDTRNVALKTRINLLPLSIGDVIQKPSEEEAEIILNPFHNTDIRRLSRVLFTAKDAETGTMDSGEHVPDQQEVFSRKMDEMRRFVYVPNYPDTLSSNMISQRKELLKVMDLTAPVANAIAKALCKEEVLRPIEIHAANQRPHVMFSKVEVLALGAIAHVIKTEQKDIEQVHVRSVVNRVRELLGDAIEVEVIHTPRHGDKATLDNPFVTKEVKKNNIPHETSHSVAAAEIHDSHEQISAVSPFEALPVDSAEANTLFELYHLKTGRQLPHSHEGLRFAQILAEQMQNRSNRTIDELIAVWRERSLSHSAKLDEEADDF